MEEGNDWKGRGQRKRRWERKGMIDQKRKGREEEERKERMGEE